MIPNSNDLPNLVGHIRRYLLERLPRLLVWGDVMLDEYVSGAVNRISPEAPIPILECNNIEFRLGGAANVAANLAALGAQVTLVGAVGDDTASQTLTNVLASVKGIDHRLLVLHDSPTTRKVRIMGPHQQMMRVDFEGKAPVDLKSQKDFLMQIFPLESRYNAIVISDYGKGMCGEYLLKDLLGEAKRANIPVFCDPKGADYKKYAGSSLITPNLKEASIVLGQPLIDPEDIKQAACQLREMLDLESCLITLGEKGMALATDSEYLHIGAVAHEVADVTGAGDTVIALMSLGRVCGLSLQDSARLANEAAGLAVGKLGSVAVSLDDLESARFATSTAARVISKILPVKDLLSKVEDLRQRGHRIVFTNGCFDLLHVGHVELLSKAAELGDILFVGLNSDASVRRLKGATRPVVSEHDRAVVLAALSSVDYVVIFEEDTPMELIETIVPDILVKGADYALSEVVGWEFVEQHGGHVETIALRPGASTSSMIERIYRYSQ